MACARLCPHRKFLRVLKKAVWHLPIGRGKWRAALTARGEGSFPLGGEIAGGGGDGLEIERVVHDNRERRAVGIDAGAAEHVADAYRAEARRANLRETPCSRR